MYMSVEFCLATRKGDSFSVGRIDIGRGKGRGKEGKLERKRKRERERDIRWTNFY